MGLSHELRLGPRTHGLSNNAQYAVTVWRDVPVPVIAAVHGVAFGGGFQLALGADLRFVAPPLSLCTDNAAMIAWAGLERFRKGQSDPLDFAARPRWPLDPQAEPVRGAGVKA